MSEELKQEEWRDIAGYEGLYQVSDLGRVRSLNRVRIVSNKEKEYQTVIKGRLLKGDPYKDVRRVILSKDGVKRWLHIGKLVAAAFLKELPRSGRLIHIDGDTHNNALPNLKWIAKRRRVREAELSKQDKQLIRALEAYVVNPACVPVELVKELDRVSKEINSFKKPLFIDSEGNSISYDHWEEFAFTGLTPDEFVLTDFYLTGFGDSEE